MPFVRKPLVAALAALFAAPAMTFAQTATKDPTLPAVEISAVPDSEDFRTDQTSTATGTETPLRDIPQFVNIVPQSVITSQGARTLQDALRNVPGITYAAPEGGTNANQLFYIRGFPAGGDLFIDGVRDIGEYNRDLFATDAVEVLKGPSALMFGRGSTGGVINQVSKRPGLGKYGDVGLSLGTYHEKRLTGDLNLPLSDTSALRLIVLGEDSGTPRDTVDVTKVGFAPSLRFGIGTATDIEFSYYYLKTSDVTDYGQPTLGPTFNWGMPPVSMEKYYGFANYDWTDHETSIATFRIDHAFNDALSIRNILRYAYYRRDMEATIATLATTDTNGNAVTAGTPADLLRVNRIHNKSRDNGDHALINQTELTWKLETGSLKHTVLTGLELADENLHRLNYNFDASPAAGIQAPAAFTSLLNPDPYTSLSYTKTPNQRSEAEARSAGIYIQDQLQFTEQWKALLGVRWDYYDSEAKVTDAGTGVPTATGGPFSRTDRMWSGRAGLIYQPTATQSYYISAGNSYNPSGELGVYGATGTNLSAVNEDLDPEQNVNYELGGQWDFTPGVQLRAALFRNEKINQRITEPGQTTVLAGKRRVDGLEFSFAGQITRNWSIYGAMAWMHGEIVKAPAPTAGNLSTQGNVPWGVPYLSGSAWTIYRLGGGWEVGGGAFGSSTFWLDDQNRAEAPGYVRWDATVAYVQRKYDVRLNFFNVFDKTYYIGGYQNTPNRVIPGTPRSAMVTFNYRFQ